MASHEALARLLHSEGDGFAQFKNASAEDQAYYRRQAEYVLNSEWLKAHDAEVAAAARDRALRDAVRVIRKTAAAPQSRMTFDGGVSRAAAEVKAMLAPTQPEPERSVIYKTIPYMVDPCPGCGQRVLGGQSVARDKPGDDWWHEGCFDSAEAMSDG